MTRFLTPELDVSASSPKGKIRRRVYWVRLCHGILSFLNTKVWAAVKLGMERWKVPPLRGIEYSGGSLRRSLPQISIAIFDVPGLLVEPSSI